MSRAVCRKNLSDPEAINRFALECVRIAGLTCRHLYTEVFPNGSTFGPGVSTVMLISESHLAVHTTPQDSALYFDLFSCKAFPHEAIIDLMARMFAVDRFDYHVISPR